jgi:hypothetical protein
MPAAIAKLVKHWHIDLKIKGSSLPGENEVEKPSLFSIFNTVFKVSKFLLEKYLNLI